VRSVNFVTLAVKNFLSIGQTPVTINFQNGVNVITGINYDKEDSKNGVGKSTIIDAIHFALFGTTTRGLNKDLIPNSYTNEKCEVILDFEIIQNNSLDVYRIVRTINPTKCFLYKNKEDITLSTIVKTNEYIQELLRSSESVFQNSVVMSMGTAVPFMAQSKIDKRKFIENILNLEIFSKMLSYIRDEHNENKKEYEIAYNKKENLFKTLQNYTDQIKEFENNKQIKLQEIKKKLTNNLQEIQKLKQNFNKIDSNNIESFDLQEEQLRQELKNRDALLKKFEEKKVEITTLLKNHKDSIIKIQEKGNICALCKRPYTESETEIAKNHVEEHIHEINLLQNKKQTVLQGIDQINTANNITNKKIKEINEKKSKLETVSRNNIVLENKVLLLEGLNNQLNENILDIQQETNKHLEKAFQQTTDEYNACTTLVDGLNEKLKVFECAKFIVSEEGVKAYIVKKMLTLLNARIAFYLQKMNANCMCTFNEFFEDEVRSEDGIARSYFNFSGGERKRIDLACLFAFLDIRRLQGNIHYSTIFYDELFDSALDNAGTECVFKILRDRQELYGENSYIITHRGEELINRADNIIMLEKRNNITYLIKQ
jgi:DNA repair exonuclease SbcCD ATPase subunit